MSQKVLITLQKSVNVLKRSQKSSGVSKTPQESLWVPKIFRSSWKSSEAPMSLLRMSSEPYLCPNSQQKAHKVCNCCSGSGRSCGLLCKRPEKADPCQVAVEHTLITSKRRKDDLCGKTVVVEAFSDRILLETRDMDYLPVDSYRKIWDGVSR